MAEQWRELSARQRRDLAALQDGRVEGVKIVPMPWMGQEPPNRRFTAMLFADFGRRGSRTSPARGGKRDDTLWIELEMFLQPQFPNQPPFLHCHTPEVEHWSMDASGSIDVKRLIEWNASIEVSSLLKHVRENLISEMVLSPAKRTGRRGSPPSPPRGAVNPVLARSMSGQWRAHGQSEGTDSRVKRTLDEVEDFMLDVRPDGHATGYPAYQVAPDDNFSLTGSVEETPRASGHLRLEMAQVYTNTGNTTNWAARISGDGMRLESGQWSGSCVGGFFAERIDAPAPAPAPAPARRPASAPVRPVSPARGRRDEQKRLEERLESKLARQSKLEEREKTLWELATSEDEYGKQLSSLVKIEKQLKKVLPRADYQSLFPGLKEILALNMRFDDDLNDTLGRYPDANAALRAIAGVR